MGLPITGAELYTLKTLSEVSMIACHPMGVIAMHVDLLALQV